MKVRNTVSALMLAFGVTGAASLATAQVVVGYDIGVAPPASRVEVIPAPREGYVYEPGHFTWDGTQWLWTEGHYIEQRPGYLWRPYVFERRGETYFYRPGFWDDSKGS